MQPVPLLSFTERLELCFAAALNDRLLSTDRFRRMGLVIAHTAGKCTTRQWPRALLPEPPSQMIRRVGALLPGPRNPDVPTGGGLPVRGYPNRSRARSSHPRSRHPFIAAAIPVVVALHPDIIGSGADAGDPCLRRWRRGRGWHRNHNRRSGSYKSVRGCGSRGRHHYNFSAPAGRKRSGDSSENSETSNFTSHRALPPSVVEAAIAGMVSWLIGAWRQNE